MPDLVLTTWHGRQHTAVDYSDMPNRLRCALGTERRIPITQFQAETFRLDELVFVLKVLGAMQ